MSATIHTEKSGSWWLATVSSRPFQHQFLKVFASNTRERAVELAAKFAQENGLPLSEVM